MARAVEERAEMICPEEVLAKISEPNIVIIGAWHDTQATVPPGPEDHKLPHRDDFNIWCIEPIPHCVMSLRQQAAQNGRIHVLPCAVSDFDGVVPFQVNRGVDMTSSLRSLIGATKEHILTVEVEVRRLDTLLEEGLLPRTVHYATLDVQGCAREAIRGGKEFLKGVQMLWAEVEFQPFYEGQALYPEVRSELEALGFRQVTEFSEADLKERWNDALFVRD